MKQYKLALIGSDTANSLSPRLMNFLAEREGVSLHYCLIDLDKNCSDKTLVDTVVQFDGVNITMPFKYKMANILCLDGGVNTVVHKNGRLVGWSTDGLGVVLALECSRIDVAGKNLLILGAGGSAHSAAQSLWESGANLFFVNRTAAKAQALASQFGGVFVSQEELRQNKTNYKFDGILSFLPLRDSLFAVDEEQIKRCDFVFDCLYGQETKLISTALQQGKKVVDGLAMLYFQGIEAFRLFCGKTVSNAFESFKEFAREIKNS